MNARFGIIAALTITLAGCNDGSTDDLFVGGSAALDCRGDGCLFAGATKPADPPKTPDPSRYGQGGHEDDGYDDDDHHGSADAGAPCNYDTECAAGERCERQHGVSYCAPHDDDSYDDHDDYANGDAGKPETPGDDEPACDGYDCDYDRSGSNSGPH